MSCLRPSKTCEDRDRSVRADHLDGGVDLRHWQPRRAAAIASPRGVCLLPDQAQCCPRLEPGLSVHHTCGRAGLRAWSFMIGSMRSLRFAQRRTGPYGIDIGLFTFHMRWPAAGWRSRIGSSRVWRRSAPTTPTCSSAGRRSASRVSTFGAERFVTGGAVWGRAFDVTPPGPAHTGAGPQRIAISFEGRISPTNQ